MGCFSAGYNLPGCLPEMDVAEFGHFSDARQFVIDALKEAEDNAGAQGAEAHAEQFCHAAEDANLSSGPFATPVMPDGYVYWVDYTA